MGKLFHSNPDLDDVMSDDTPDDLIALGWDRYTWVTVHRRDMRSIAAALSDAAERLAPNGRLHWIEDAAKLAWDYADAGKNPDEQG